MEVNNTTAADPTLANNNRANDVDEDGVNDVTGDTLPDTVTDESAQTTVADAPPETTVADVPVAEVETTNAIGAETDETGDVVATGDTNVDDLTIDDPDMVDDLDPTDDIVDDASYMAAKGFDADADGALSFELTNAIKGGANMQETFKNELLGIAEEEFGTSSMINQIMDDDGNNIMVYRGENGDEFRIIEYSHDDMHDLNKSALIFADDSAIELQMLDNGINGVGVHRISAENEDGEREYSFVNAAVIQEGTVGTDENGNFVQNYDQINRADGSVIEDAQTTFHQNGMISTEYDDEDGIGHLLVGNANHTASKHYTSEDNYTNAIDESYAVLGEDGFVADWDDGSGIDTADALYKGFDDSLTIDPFFAELLAELQDPNFVSMVDGEDGTEEVDEVPDGEFDSEAASVVDTELLAQGLIDENGNPIEPDGANTPVDTVDNNTNVNPDEVDDIGNIADNNVEDESQNQQDPAAVG